jgi:tRNA-2-methylthio-N6-dimethylallyladenosine synthase
MFSFKYSERPGTLAAKRLADDVPEEEKDRRLSALQELQKRIQTRLHQQSVGAVVEVLVDSVSRRHETELSGRTTGNTVVNFPGDSGQLGAFVMVEIERAGAHSLWGRARSLTAREAGPTL